MLRSRRHRLVAWLALAALVTLWSPAVAAAHSDLESATPADKATVASPFSGPVVLTFSEELASGSKADLLGPGGAGVASATVDGPGKTMTITPFLGTSFEPGDYEVRWVSVAVDGDLLRGTLTFTVAPAPATPTPTATVTITSSVTETSRPATPVPTPEVSPESPSPSASSFLGENGSDANSGDVILPIVVALLVIVAGAVYLLGRRNRPTTRR
jgi:methionine-rich copper-binding protein CopC